jgi:hypothetical protein
MNRLLVLIGWRSGPGSVRFADASFRIKLGFVLVVSVMTVLIGKYVG